MRRFLAVVVIAVLWPTVAEAVPVNLRNGWPCEPAAIYLDPSAPDDVLAAVTQWRRAFRPDWTLTTTPADAQVELWMRKPNLEDAAGLATIWGADDRYVRAVVEIDPAPKVDQGNVARHELGHVAGLEHNTESSWAHAMSPYPQTGRYSAKELLWMAASARRCR